ncbi:MAG: HDIG domain-containing protein [Chloroflexi bacterium]|nr:HDIG domain-containing protein [Chloroflexota bacterium]
MLHYGSRPTVRTSAGSAWQAAWSLIFVTIIAVSATLILAVPLGSAPDALSLGEGDVATVDITAPRSVTYVSQVQTSVARAAAADAVSDVYAPPDSRVARQQIARAGTLLDYIGTVRADSFATPQQKTADLAGITDLTISDTAAATLLTLTDNEWSAVRTETIAVIERVLSGQVRSDRVDDAVNRLPALVSVSLPEAQAGLVTMLATPYIGPNSFYNEAATTAARAAAREAVAPISQSFVQGQTVVSRGKVITVADLEALAALGLLQPKSRWQGVVSIALSVIMSTAVLGLYMRRFYPRFFISPRLVAYLGTLFAGFLLVARLMVPGHTVLPFLFPSAALAMLITVSLGPNVAITTIVTFAALAGVLADGRLDVTTYVAVGGIVAALSLNKADRVYTFFWAGLAAALANAGVVLVFRLADPTGDTLGTATLLAASLINGIMSAAITLGGFFVLGSVFDITTTLQLVDLARPNHPLLQFMLRQAPGTYQHSLQIANLAEQAAERIGANTMLIRVGALFHDVGKALHPEYFVENQIGGANPHDHIPAETSARYIIQHVPDGLKMAAQHRLPAVVRAAIAEHHGTNMTWFQYQRAIKEAGGDESKVDPAKFRYPGPKPQSRETALLMLADGCEAKSRSDQPRNAQEIEKIVKSIFDSRMAGGQFDECELTMHDLQMVRESFTETLKGFFHSRLKYPEETVETHSAE